MHQGDHRLIWRRPNGRKSPFIHLNATFGLHFLIFSSSEIAKNDHIDLELFSLTETYSKGSYSTPKRDSLGKPYKPPNRGPSMSLVAIVWSIEQRIVVNSTARHVLLCLANRATATGEAAFPSVETLQLDTGLSERTIRYKLDHLESLGVIKKGDQRIAAKFVGRADRTPTCYDLCIPDSWLKAWNERRGAAVAPRGATGCNGEQNEVQIKALPGAPIAPKPSPEPFEEPPLGCSEISGGSEIGSNQGGGELDLSLLPEALHLDIHRLVSITEKPQAYADLLAARIKSDKSLPKERQIQYPTLWLKKIIAKGNPDFSTAIAIARERETRTLEEQQAKKTILRRQESESRQTLEIAEAQALLCKYSEEELLQVANDAIEELPGPIKNKKQHEVRSEVFSRSLGKAMTRVAILNVMRRRLDNDKHQYA